MIWWEQDCFCPATQIPWMPPGLSILRGFTWSTILCLQCHSSIPLLSCFRSKGHMTSSQKMCSQSIIAGARNYRLGWKKATGRNSFQVIQTSLCCPVASSGRQKVIGPIQQEEPPVRCKLRSPSRFWNLPAMHVGLLDMVFWTVTWREAFETAHPKYPQLYIICNSI